MRPDNDGGDERRPAERTASAPHRVTEILLTASEHGDARSEGGGAAPSAQPHLHPMTSIDLSEGPVAAEAHDSREDGGELAAWLERREARHARARELAASQAATIFVNVPVPHAGPAGDDDPFAGEEDADEPMAAGDFGPPEPPPGGPGEPPPPVPPLSLERAERVGRRVLDAMERAPEAQRRRSGLGPAAAVAWATLRGCLDDDECAAVRGERPGSGRAWGWLEGLLEGVLSLANVAACQEALASGGLSDLVQLAVDLEAAGAGGTPAALHALVALCNVAERDGLRGALVEAAVLPALERLSGHSNHHVAFEACYLTALLACGSDPAVAAAVAARPRLLASVAGYVQTHDAATEGTAYDWLDVALDSMAAAARSPLGPVRAFAAFCFANVAHKQPQQLRAAPAHLETVKGLARGADRTAAALALVALALAGGGGLAGAFLRERGAALAAAGLSGAEAAGEAERDAFWRAQEAARAEAAALRGELEAARAEAARLRGDPAAVAAIPDRAGVEALAARLEAALAAAREEVTRRREAEAAERAVRPIEEARNCKVCCQAPATILLLPCRHLHLCPRCSAALHGPPALCPVCRTVIAERIAVFNG